MRNQKFILARKTGQMIISEQLFLTVSNIVGIRVTPDNLRTQIEAISGSGGITSKVKTEIIKELLLAFNELEKKLDAK